MKVKLILTVSLFILILSGCKNATSSKSTITVEDLLGSWTFTHQLFTMTLTTNIAADIVDSYTPGTGSLSINKTNVPLNFVHIWADGYLIDRTNTDYTGISIQSYPGIFQPYTGDNWEYAIYNNSEYINLTSNLSHYWTGEIREWESWYGDSPDFTFSDTDFTFNVVDTLTAYDYNTSTWDTAYVSGTVTAPTTHLQANQPTQFTEDETFPENSHTLTFYDDSTYVEEVIYPSRYIEEGTWFIDNGVLHLIYTWTDWEDEEHTDEYLFAVTLSQGHLTLEANGDACDDSDPLYPVSDCFSDIAWEFWPLEGTDILAAVAGSFNELIKYEQPAESGDPSGDSGIPLSQNRSYQRRDARIKWQGPHPINN